MNTYDTYLDTLAVSIDATPMPTTNYPDISRFKYADAWEVAVHKGDTQVTVDFYTGKKVLGVTRADVIYALLSDGNVADCEDFADWANQYGYNPDSITDKLLYSLCIDNANKLNTLFTPEEIATLNDLFTDY